jgi:hypothetical protein
LYDFKGFLSDDKGYEWFFDIQGVATQRPNKQDYKQRKGYQIDDVDKYDTTLHPSWDLPQSKSMNVRYAVQRSPQPNS